MRYLGIDFGTRKIGLALGDGAAKVAVPYSVIPGGPDAVKRLLALAESESIDHFVVGLAIPEEHQSTTQMERTMDFVADLADASAREVHVVDEQFSSAEARRVQKEYGAEAAEDALAAMLILQAHFDEQD